jgi:hypothetical protein
VSKINIEAVVNMSNCPSIYGYNMPTANQGLDLDFSTITYVTDLYIGGNYCFNNCKSEGGVSNVFNVLTPISNNKNFDTYINAEFYNCNYSQLLNVYSSNDKVNTLTTHNNFYFENTHFDGTMITYHDFYAVNEYSTLTGAISDDISSLTGRINTNVYYIDQNSIFNFNGLINLNFIGRSDDLDILSSNFYIFQFNVSENETLVTNIYGNINISSNHVYKTVLYKYDTVSSNVEANFSTNIFMRLVDIGFDGTMDLGSQFEVLDCNNSLGNSTFAFNDSSLYNFDCIVPGTS